MLPEAPLEVMYPVTSVFRSIQGEGHFVGSPMTFVRLAGCSVGGCSIRKECDEAPWRATEKLAASQIVTRCLLWGAGERVCVTGGEPTDHDLVPLVAGLRDAGFKVHIETSGVRSIAGAPFEWITVSPKTPDYVQREGHTLKVVARPGTTWADVMALDEGTAFFHRYLQPLTQPDGTSNINEVLRLLFDNNFGGHGRWSLSIQAHKAWGLK